MAKLEMVNSSQHLLKEIHLIKILLGTAKAQQPVLLAPRLSWRHTVRWHIQVKRHASGFTSSQMSGNAANLAQVSDAWIYHSLLASEGEDSSETAHVVV